MKWSRKNPRTLSEELQARGIAASPNTVADVMRGERYSLRVNRKSVAETRHRDHPASNDPDCEVKAADVIGLYLNPPQHAAAFCFDEKSEPRHRALVSFLVLALAVPIPSAPP